MNAFFVGLERQMSIVSALLIREVRLRNSKHAFVQLFDLAEALFFIIVHFVIFAFMGRHLLIGDSLLTFITTGVAPVLYFRTISIRTATAINSSKHLLNIPGIQPIDYAIARALMEVMSFNLLFIFFLAGIYLTGFSKSALPYNFAPVILAVFCLTVFGFGVGLINSFFILVFPLWKFCWAMISRVQIFFSAVFFIPEYMPPMIRHILAYSPMLHFVSLFRTGFYPSYPTELISVPYILSFAGGSVILGMMFERVWRDRALG